MGALAATGSATAAERATFLARLEAELRADPRINAAWVGGSIGRGESDDWSDIDIHLAVADSDCPTLNAVRRAFVSRFGEPILIQEAPQNAPRDGTFLLVLYRAPSAPLEVDWSWRPTSAAALPERAVVLFDRSGGLPRTPAWVKMSPAEVAQEISLRTSFFWAMAFIAAKKIARREASATFSFLRMLHQARDSVRDRLAGTPVPTWGAIGAPSDTLPPTDLQAQIVDLSELLEDMARLQPTTNGEGGLVTPEAVSEVMRFLQLVAYAPEA